MHNWNRLDQQHDYNSAEQHDAAISKEPVYNVVYVVCPDTHYKKFILHCTFKMLLKGKNTILRYLFIYLFIYLKTTIMACTTMDIPQIVLLFHHEMLISASEFVAVLEYIPARSLPSNPSLFVPSQG